MVAENEVSSDGVDRLNLLADGCNMLRYLPRDPEHGLLPSLGIPFPDWPLLGRVGYCAEGADWRGAFILVVPFDKAQTWWDVIVRGVRLDQEQEDFFDEVFQTEYLIPFLVKNPVVWAPPNLDGLVESRVFGWRAVQRYGALKRGAIRYTLGGLRFAPASEAERVEAALWPREAGEDI